MKGAAKKIAIAMSGGIDSAVAAMIMKDRGYECIGVFMKNWDKRDDDSVHCTIEEDRIDMKQICERLEIPDFEVEFIKEYWSKVFTPFVATCQDGVATPNPDVYCNRFVKFQEFQKHIYDKFGLSTFATGHYARLDHSWIECLHQMKRHEEAQRLVPRLLRGVDDIKDQSYFLSLTRGIDLKHALFPIGDYRKSDIREMAKERLAGLRVMTKKESTGICFIGKRSFPEFMQQYIYFTPGRFIDVDTGRAVGEHSGMEILTVGQKARIKNQLEKYYIVSKSKDLAPLVTKQSKNPKCQTPINSATLWAWGRNIKKKTSAVQQTNNIEYDYVRGDVFVCLGVANPARFALRARMPAAVMSWVSGKLPWQLAAQMKVYYDKQGVNSLSSQESTTTVDLSALFACSCQCRYRKKPVECYIEMKCTNPEEIHTLAVEPNSTRPLSASDKLVLLEQFVDPASVDIIATVPSDSSLVLSDLLAGWDVVVHFKEPEMDVCPGQILAVYQGEACLGGGPIQSADINFDGQQYRRPVAIAPDAVDAHP